MVRTCVSIFLCLQCHWMTLWRICGSVWTSSDVFVWFVFLAVQLCELCVDGIVLGGWYVC